MTVEQRVRVYHPLSMHQLEHCEPGPCFFDSRVHQLLTLADSRRQSLYHFTIGRALVDECVSSLLAYPEWKGYVGP